jgi:hypothetical protein
MELILLISLTIAPTIFAIVPTFAVASPVDAASTIIAEVNGQLNICHPPDPCFTATLQANASGTDAEDLAGMLLIYRTAPSPPQPCMAAVTGNASPQTYAPTATLKGTLHPGEASNATCAGGLQGFSVTLFVDSMSGIIRLTTVSAAGYTEFLGSGTGTLVITQFEQSA